ncbi:MAG: glycosyltransferase [Actinomycetota bacterium]
MEDLHELEQPLRMIHVITRYLRGGSEQRIRDIVRSFPDAQHRVVVGLDSDLDAVTRELDPTEMHHLPTLVREPDPRRDAEAFVTITRLFRRRQVDLVVTHQSKAGVLGRAAARVAGLPVVHSLSMASFGPGYPRWQDGLFRTVERRLHRVTISYAVVGHDLARRYASVGVPRHKLTIVRSGVRIPGDVRDEDARSATRESHGLPHGRPLVLYMGSLDARKNVLDLVPFLDRLLRLGDERRPPFLAIAGQGPLSHELSASLSSAGLGSHSSLLGYVSNPGGLIAAVDCVVLLSGAEGVPQVLVQAGAIGTPFVAYDVDGVRELLALDAEGTLVPAGDLRAAADAASRALSASPGMARGSVDLSSWDPEQIRLGYRRLIEGALAEHARSSSRGSSARRRGASERVVAAAGRRP